LIRARDGNQTEPKLNTLDWNPIIGLRELNTLDLNPVIGLRDLNQTNPT